MHCIPQIRNTGMPWGCSTQELEGRNVSDHREGRSKAVLKKRPLTAAVDFDTEVNRGTVDCVFS